MKKNGFREIYFNDNFNRSTFQEWIKRRYSESRRISRTTWFTRCPKWRIRRRITIRRTPQEQPAPAVTAACTPIRTRRTHRPARLRSWLRIIRRIIRRTTASQLPDTANRHPVTRVVSCIRRRSRWLPAITDPLSLTDQRHPCRHLPPVTRRTGRRLPRRGRGRRAVLEFRECCCCFSDFSTLCVQHLAIVRYNIMSMVSLSAAVRRPNTRNPEERHVATTNRSAEWRLPEGAGRPPRGIHRTSRHVAPRTRILVRGVCLWAETVLPSTTRANGITSYVFCA